MTILLKNRSARHNYFIESTTEAGIELLGHEVKSLRAGQGSIVEAHVSMHNGEMMLQNCFIPLYKYATRITNHEPTRFRRLLLKAREIRKFSGMVDKKGMTIVPLSVYSNKRGLIKLEIGLAKGKKDYDKRQSEKEKEWKREKIDMMRV